MKIFNVLFIPNSIFLKICVKINIPARDPNSVGEWEDNV